MSAKPSAWSSVRARVPGIARASDHRAVSATSMGPVRYRWSRGYRPAHGPRRRRAPPPAGRPRDRRPDRRRRAAPRRPPAGERALRSASGSAARPSAARWRTSARGAGVGPPGARLVRGRRSARRAARGAHQLHRDGRGPRAGRQRAGAGRRRGAHDPGRGRGVRHRARRRAVRAGAPAPARRSRRGDRPQPRAAGPRAAPARARLHHGVALRRPGRGGRRPRRAEYAMQAVAADARQAALLGVAPGFPLLQTTTRSRDARDTSSSSARCTTAATATATAPPSPAAPTMPAASAFATSPPAGGVAIGVDVGGSGGAGPSPGRPGWSGRWRVARRDRPVPRWRCSGRSTRWRRRRPGCTAGDGVAGGGGHPVVRGRTGRRSISRRCPRCWGPPRRAAGGPEPAWGRTHPGADPSSATARRGLGAWEVAVVPDLAAAALGEHRLGSGRGVERFLCVALGTGANAAAVVGGVPVDTAFGCLGDAGHVKVEADGPPCPCGGRGCLEAVASGHALARDGAALGHAGAREVVAAASAATPQPRPWSSARAWRWAVGSRPGARCCGPSAWRWPAGSPGPVSSCSPPPAASSRASAPLHRRQPGARPRRARRHRHPGRHLPARHGPKRLDNLGGVVPPSPP